MYASCHGYCLTLSIFHDVIRALHLQDVQLSVLLALSCSESLCFFSCIAAALGKWGILCIRALGKEPHSIGKH